MLDKEALRAEEAVADCEYVIRERTTSTFRANAIFSQNALRNKPFRELYISISNAERRSIDHDYEEEVSQATDDLNLGRITKRAYQSRLHCADELRKSKLSEVRPDKCNNWGGNEDRLDRVVDYLSEWMPVEMMESMNEIVSRADELNSNAQKLRYDGLESEADLLDTKANEMRQQFLTRIRRAQLSSSAGKSPPASQAKPSIDLKQLKNERAKQREAVRAHRRMYKGNKPRRRRKKIVRTQCRRFHGSSIKEFKDASKASFFCGLCHANLAGGVSSKCIRKCQRPYVRIVQCPCIKGRFGNCHLS